MPVQAPQYMAHITPISPQNVFAYQSAYSPSQHSDSSTPNPLTQLVQTQNQSPIYQGTGELLQPDGSSIQYSGPQQN